MFVAALPVCLIMWALSLVAKARYVALVPPVIPLSSRIGLTAVLTPSGMASPFSALSMAMPWTSVKRVDMTAGLYFALYLACMSLADLYSGMFIQPLFMFTYAFLNLRAYKSFDENKPKKVSFLKNKPKKCLI